MPYISLNNKKILFIHIPKTGGTSIEKILEKQAPLHFCSRIIPNFLRTAPEHLTLQELEVLLGRDFFQYKFTIVRNPYSRLESEYRMRSILSKERFFKDLPSFPVWLNNQLVQTKQNEFFQASHFRPQVQFLGAGVKIFKFELGLAKIVQTLAKDLALELEYDGERYLDSSHHPIEINWDWESIRQVNEFYKNDFEFLSYDMRKNKPTFAL